MINKYLFIAMTGLHAVLCVIGFCMVISALVKHYIARPFHTGLKLALGGFFGCFLRELWVVMYIDSILLDWSTWVLKIAVTFLLLVAINYTRTAKHYRQ